MPGRRLTRAERRSIADGLTRGLDLTAIARGLGRPTSTVLREVARNGGPGRYHPELAQYATARRARRRPRPAPSTPERYGGDPDPRAAAAFVTEFSAALVETGLPRTAAGVLAWLYASETGSCTAGELAQRLQVSAATVSQAVGFLNKCALIRRGYDGRSRRHRYYLDDDAGFRSVVVVVRAGRRLAGTALRGADTFGTDTPAGARLAVTGRLLEQLGDDVLRSARRRWQTTADGTEDAPGPGAPTPSPEDPPPPGSQAGPPVPA
ncbi:MarR family transcriptional regulator [Streptomyces sp. NPDC020875]|uniref:GbsR/MarR family transcriptional regulator n=1 Tax=Streptomyces sp. NPDC020875 TaxID=3154898 RepID=UPI0033E6C2BA